MYSYDKGNFFLHVLCDLRETKFVIRVMSELGGSVYSSLLRIYFSIPTDQINGEILPEPRLL